MYNVCALTLWCNLALFILLRAPAQTRVPPFKSSYPHLLPGVTSVHVLEIIYVYVLEVISVHVLETG